MIRRIVYRVASGFIPFKPVSWALVDEFVSLCFPCSCQRSLCWHSGWKETAHRNYRPRDFKSCKYTPTQTKLSIPSTISLQLDLQKATDFQKTGGYKWQREKLSGMRHWFQQITVKNLPFSNIDAHVSTSERAVQVRGPEDAISLALEKIHLYVWTLRACLAYNLEVPRREGQLRPHTDWRIGIFLILSEDHKGIRGIQHWQNEDQSVFWVRWDVKIFWDQTESKRCAVTRCSFLQESTLIPG